MVTAVLDHQPQTTARMGRSMSVSARERTLNRPKADIESAIPPEDEPPSTRERPAAVEHRSALLHRVPTYLQPSLPWRNRLIHFTFAWYTVTYVSLFFSLPFSLSLTRPLSHLTLP